MKYTIFILCLLVAFSARAANPAFSDFNTNQFNPAGNKIVVKNGALLTNTVTYSNATFNGIILATNAGITNLISGKLNIGSEPTDNNRSLTVGSGIHAYQDAFGTSFSGNGSIYSDAALSFGTVLQKQNAWSMNGSLGNFLIRDAADNPMTNFMFGDYTTNLMFGIWWNSNPPALYLRTISNTLPADFWISGTFHGNGSGLTNLNSTNWTTWSDSIAGYALQANGFNDGLYSGAFLEVGDGVSGNNQGGSAVLNAGDFSTFTGSYIRLAPGTDSPVGGTGSFYGGASSNAYGGNVSVGGATAAAGGDANIEGGSGLGGVASGGNIHLTPGSGIGGGSAGKIYFSSPPIGNGSGLTNLSLTNVSASGLTLYGVTTNGNTGGSNWVGGISLWNPATGKTVVLTNGGVTTSGNLTDTQNGVSTVISSNRLTTSIILATNAASANSRNLSWDPATGYLTLTNPSAAFKGVTLSADDFGFPNGIQSGASFTMSGGNQYVGTSTYRMMVQTSGSYNFGFYANNVLAAGVLLAGAYSLGTNSGSSVSCDFSKGAQLLSTNAAFQFLSPAVDSTKTMYQKSFFFVTNSTGSGVAITVPATVTPVGSAFVTNLTRCEWECYASLFTNAYFQPIR